MVSNIITKANAKDKVIDFRDQLNMADVENYAHIHQASGGKGSYPSVIRAVLCDYSAGTGDKSVTVSANFDPTLPFEWMQVCNNAAGVQITPKSGAKIHVNYNYSQERVNIHRKGADGFAPVNKAIIQRAPVRSDGEEARYPWSVKITNFEAKAIEKDQGSISYDPKTARNTKEAFIMLSDRDMFRMMKSITRFIDIWELGTRTLIAEGRAKMAQERTEE